MKNYLTFLSFSAGLLYAGAALAQQPLGTATPETSAASASASETPTPTLNTAEEARRRNAERIRREAEIIRRQEESEELRRSGRTPTTAVTPIRPIPADESPTERAEHRRAVRRANNWADRLPVEIAEPYSKADEKADRKKAHTEKAKPAKVKAKVKHD